MDVVKRFLKYISYDTKSDDSSGVTPSSKGQLVLADALAEELKSIGLQDVNVDENGYVMGTLPSNTNKDLSTIGFIAHMDTSPDFSGKNVKPQIIENYDGNDIVLNKELNIVMSTKEFPELSLYKGHKLITTDGTTLLGADDKAGIAEIITAIEYLTNHPEIEHGTIKIAFTPDEEIGQGADHFNVEKFGAKYAYTIDGGREGELEYENFNAAGAKVEIKGKNVHPGTAKGKMVNSQLIAAELLAMMPKEETPEHTEEYEGFYLLSNITGSVENTTMKFIIRDFFNDSFEARKNNMSKWCDEINKKYGEGTCILDMKDQYYNMKEKVEPVKFIVDIAFEAMKKSDVVPTIVPIRGGTDGARLSFMGLPTPNIFTGGENFHGKYEYISTQAMEKAVQVILNIVNLYVEKSL
ncbi:peptidase T [Clostridium cadaveris]|uniref:Peptidase T n=1 Tax=Clostridium cadaveris TaxID=1529 RepID=A0A1I2PYH4_9CLOT|nr:peptidase T [Clostridium cadaveris]MDM8313439.1 peptidase T [Clostridium cadaveris]MDY4950467.1 peptidase T [Clostridium cadaveris]NME66087.1 peptidase T [Clostridium cadaveris]SFG18686.1 tripeptide aminopeptidase [Clostridium cadaveris]